MAEDMIEDAVPPAPPRPPSHDPPAHPSEIAIAMHGISVTVKAAVPLSEVEATLVRVLTHGRARAGTLSDGFGGAL